MTKLLISPKEATKRKSDFFTARPEKYVWPLHVEDKDGQEYNFIGATWRAESAFGKVEDMVVTDENGNPLFNRPCYHEAPNVNCVAWGRDDDGEIKVAMIQETRPHALDPEGSENSIMFSQVPMGFIDKIISKEDRERLEKNKEAAVREVAEETGAGAILGITQPKYPWHSPNPTFVATWSELFFIQVDLKKLGKLRTERDELIYKADFLPIKKLVTNIREGKDGKAVVRACTSLSLLMIFFATYPEFFPGK